MRTQTLRIVVVGFYIFFVIYLGISVSLAKSPSWLQGVAPFNGWWLIILIVLLNVPMFTVIAAEKRQRKLESQKIVETE